MNIKLPNNDTGNALQRMQESGTDLTKELEIDFFISVPSEKSGFLVVEKIKQVLPEAILEVDEDEDKDNTFTCYCKIVMVPLYKRVVEIELLLDNIAKHYEGYIDGFGSYGN